MNILIYKYRKNTETNFKTEKERPQPFIPLYRNTKRKNIYIIKVICIN